MFISQLESSLWLHCFVNVKGCLGFNIVCELLGWFNLRRVFTVKSSEFSITAVAGVFSKLYSAYGALFITWGKKSTYHLTDRFVPDSSGGNCD